MLELHPCHCYVTGPFIPITMAALRLIGKRFGISSNLRTYCTIGGAARLADYFQFDWEAQRWNLLN